MVRLIYLVTLATLVCFHFIRAENNSVEVKASENEVVIEPVNDQLEDSHQRFARQATTKRVTTKKGSTKKANIVAVI